jgi:hypothetical protein
MFILYQHRLTALEHLFQTDEARELNGHPAIIAILDSRRAIEIQKQIKDFL